MIDIFIRRGGSSDTVGKKDCEEEIEVRAIHYKPKTSWDQQNLKEARKISSLGPSERAWPC